MKNCIRGYFDANDPKIKVLFAACCAFLFSFYIADFAQDAIGQITDTVVYYPLIAITLQLKYFNKKEQLQVSNQELENPNIPYS